MPQSKLRLSFVRVQDWEQALDLMQVRNECREGMTHVTQLIDVRQQSRFYNEHLSTFRGDGLYEAYLLLDDEHPIGYGLLKWDGKKYWMTAGLIKEYRGQGLSRLLISYITEMGHREGAEVWIDVWDDNPALFGDIRIGFEFVEDKLVDGKILHIMKHNRNRILKDNESFWMASHGKKNEAIPYHKMEEMVEVDKISRESYDPGKADPNLMMSIEKGPFI